MDYEKPNSFASLSFTFGLLTITTMFMMTIYLPFIFGGLSLVFAILSRTDSRFFSHRVKIGMICATVGLIVNLAFTVTSVYSVFTDPKLKEQLNDTCESMYGYTYDEMIDQITEAYQ